MHHCGPPRAPALPPPPARGAGEKLSRGLPHADALGTPGPRPATICPSVLTGSGGVGLWSHLPTRGGAGAIGEPRLGQQPLCRPRGARQHWLHHPCWRQHPKPTSKRWRLAGQVRGYHPEVALGTLEERRQREVLHAVPQRKSGQVLIGKGQFSPFFYFFLGFSDEASSCVLRQDNRLVQGDGSWVQAGGWTALGFFLDLLLKAQNELQILSCPSFHQAKLGDSQRPCEAITGSPDEDQGQPQGQQSRPSPCCRASSALPGLRFVLLRET